MAFGASVEVPSCLACRRYLGCFFYGQIPCRDLRDLSFVDLSEVGKRPFSSPQLCPLGSARAKSRITLREDIVEALLSATYHRIRRRDPLGPADDTADCQVEFARQRYRARHGPFSQVKRRSLCGDEQSVLWCVFWRLPINGGFCWTGVIKDDIEWHMEDRNRESFPSLKHHWCFSSEKRDFSVIFGSGRLTVSSHSLCLSSQIVPLFFRLVPLSAIVVGRCASELVPSLLLINETP